MHALLAVSDFNSVAFFEEEKNSTPIELRSSTSGLPTAVLKTWQNIYIHDKDNPVQGAKQWLAEKAETEKVETVLLIGLGLGYELGQILNKLSNIKNIIVYERYPELIKVALSLRDYSRDILQRHLEFYSWPTFGELRNRISSSKVKILTHPVLGNIYEEEKYGLENHSRGSGKKIVILITGLLSRDIVFLLELMGFETLPVEITKVRPSTFQKFLFSSKADAVFSVNYVKEVPYLSRAAGIPVVFWEIDPTIELIPPLPEAHSNTIIYSYRKARIPLLKEAGFFRVDYLPLASNHFRFRPSPLTDEQRIRYGADISYVGSSMVNEGKRLLSLCLDRLSSPHEKEKIIRAVERQNKCFSKFILPDLLPTLIKGLSMPWVIEDTNGTSIDATMCIAEECASRRRITVIRSLSTFHPKYRVRIWGDDGWRSVIPPGVEYSGPAGHYHELPIIYNATKINIDINRIYQKEIVPLRVFDVLATGSFILVDHSDEAAKLFDGKVVMYNSLKELREKVEYYLKNEEERLAIARECREVILKRHTLSQRLQKILSDLQVLGWL
ncbi:protein of unknown function [Thermodesulforhabdus norvegica]|uniref:Uncharacterized protein n=2 Tax=Thermodesulforhabdus norvegica TaxID=39841 RepID=A0A1I4QT91_9BACT|nr:protein of unknown function [Thermodesulforhabdus norvegica]